MFDLGHERAGLVAGEYHLEEGERLEPASSLPARCGTVAVLTGLLGGGTWSSSDLVEIVGAGWRGDALQEEALAVLLRAAIPPSHHLGLGDVWEQAVVSLKACRGQLSPSQAENLVASWRQQAARRTEAWQRPRAQRSRAGRRSEIPVGDLVELMA